MPAIQPPQRNELSDNELDRIDALVHEFDFSLEALDGFFSALVIGPGEVAQEEYLEVLAANGPLSDELVELLQKLWNDIARRVKLDPQTAEDASFPLLAFPEDVPEEDSPELDTYDYPVGADWAAGFLLGASLRSEQWDERMEQSEELAQDFADLESLLVDDEEDIEDEGEEARVNGKDGAPVLLGFRERMAILGEIPYLLHDMHQWRLQENAPPQKPVRREAKPERNAECPCGSGKKFKKCCGDPAKLH
jgi:uncharacterized protein